MTCRAIAAESAVGTMPVRSKPIILIGDCAISNRSGVDVTMRLRDGSCRHSSKILSNPRQHRRRGRQMRHAPRRAPTCYLDAWRKRGRSGLGHGNAGRMGSDPFAAPLKVSRRRGRLGQNVRIARRRRDGGIDYPPNRKAQRSAGGFPVERCRPATPLLPLSVPALSVGSGIAYWS